LFKASSRRTPSVPENYYRDQVAQLREALSGNSHAEATELIRKLIDRIVLTPVEEEHGHKTLSIDLHGHLAGILSLASKARKPLSESGFPVESIKLVAGARNRHYLLFRAEGLSVISPR
jgi:hypothetical protein